MYGRAPKALLTGSHRRPVKKLRPKVENAGAAPWASDQRRSARSATSPTATSAVVPWSMESPMRRRRRTGASACVTELWDEGSGNESASRYLTLADGVSAFPFAVIFATSAREALATESGSGAYFRVASSAWPFVSAQVQKSTSVCAFAASVCFV